MFDHVAIAVSDFVASERFYRTVLSVLGVEPSHADAGVVEWEDWDIGPADREHPLSRGLHVGFRARGSATSTTCGSACATCRPPGTFTPRSRRTPGYDLRTMSPAACS
jgi:catechol 2,3-dioxygenase-like lactoylglutathione lyase family enzyme